MPGRDRLLPFGLRLTLLTLIAALPAMLAVLVAVRHPWWPAGDDAIIAMKIGDVFSSHPPLQGMRSTAGLADPSLAGHHLGPLQMYLMAPVVAVLGGGPTAVLIAVLLLHLLSTAACLWVADRIGGARLMVLLAVAIAALQAGAGGQTLFRPLNPFVALMPMLLMALTCWALLAGDRALTPLYAFAATFVAQANLAFVPVVLVVSAVLVISWLRGRGRRGRRRRRRRGVAWNRTIALTLGLLVLTWWPVLWEQLSYHPGNLTQAWRYATAGSDTSGGAGARLAAGPWAALIWLLGHLPPSFGLGNGSVVAFAPPPLMLLGLIEVVVLVRIARRSTIDSVRAGARTVLLVSVAMWITLSLKGIAGNAAEYWLLPIRTLTPLAIVVLAWSLLARLPRRLRPRAWLRTTALAGGAVLSFLLGVQSLLTIPWGDVDQADEVTAPVARYLREQVRPDSPVVVNPQGAYPFFSDASALGYRLEQQGLRVYSLSRWPYREDTDWRHQDQAPRGAVQVSLVEVEPGRAPNARPPGQEVTVRPTWGRPTVRVFVQIPAQWRR